MLGFCALKQNRHAAVVHEHFVGQISQVGLHERDYLQFAG